MGKFVSNLLFQFDSAEAADHFWRWLCGAGEQEYWDYMRYREMDEDGDITGLQFDYKKAEQGLITVKCGRWDGGESDG